MSRPGTRAGFTLIELVIVIVVVTIAAVGIGSAFAYMARSQVLSADLQRAAQLAQECAEHIVGLGRRPGSYAAVVPVANNSTICNAVGAAPAGFQRVVNVRDQTVFGAGALCAAGWTCKHVEVIARRGSASVTLNFMMINY